MVGVGGSCPNLLRDDEAPKEPTFDYVLDTSQVREDVQVVLWPASWFHGDIYVGKTVPVAVRRPRCAPRGVFARGCRNKAMAMYRQSQVLRVAISAQRVRVCFGAKQGAGRGAEIQRRV